MTALDDFSAPTLPEPPSDEERGVEVCGFCLGTGTQWWSPQPCHECEGRGMVLT